MGDRPVRHAPFMRRAAVALAFGGSLLAATPALAAKPPTGTLRTTSARVLWAGVVARDATLKDRFVLKVRLPRDVWRGRRGGLQVAFRWAGIPPDNVSLRVLRDGREVARSTGRFAGLAQSVLVPRAPNGRYLVVAEFDSVSPARSIRYEGLAEVEFAPKQKPSRLLLPDLASRPQRHVTFDTPPSIFYEPGPPAGESCFGTEVEEQGAQTCLRFDQFLANVGEGPLELRFALPLDPASGERRIIQRIYKSVGSGFRDRSAGEWEFHSSHNHYHYNGFARSRLWRATRGGALIGARPVGTGRKVGFCVTDTHIDAWARKGDGPRVYQFPACISPAQGDGRNSYLVQGISRGWGDVYDWFLPDQFIDVAGVRDGLYALQTIVDPDNTIREANERNNCGSVLVRLSGMATGSPRAMFAGRGPSC